MAIKEVLVITLQAWLATEDVVLVDVREPDEWAAGHIEGAIHVPLGAFKSGAFELPELAGKKLVFQCRSGVRSMAAAEIVAARHPDVELWNLTGGILAWIEDGGAVVK